MDAGRQVGHREPAGEKQSHRDAGELLGAMTPDRWRKIEELYHAARERGAGVLADTEPEVRHQVELMLAQDSGGKILDTPAADLLADSSVARLTPGTQLGPYRIEGVVGAGGMGQVYRALDTRLDRKVAIKVSREQFSARFEREARAIAALNHPQICTLYDVGPDYLVMELLDGSPLRGPLPVKQALEYALQILDALEAAHRQGILHRDLKPANILLTKRGVKLLDFGLAKMAATQSQDVTQAGMAMGTPAYMAPEQWEGKAGDARSDIYAFGCLFYELLTGKSARERTALALPSLDRIVERCLAADPDKRFQTASDLKFALESVRESMNALSPARTRIVLPWAAAGALAALIIAVWVLYFRQPPDAQPVTRVMLNAPQNMTFEQTAISPDGRRLAFTSEGESGRLQLWVREFESAAPRLLAGTDGARNPFWSPDGVWIGFFDNSQLKKVKASGGIPQKLANAPDGRGGTWNRSGVIVFQPDFSGPLQQIPENGGSPRPASQLGAGESSHRWPRFLPDGIHFLYSTGFAETERRAIYVGSLESQQRIRLVDSEASADFVSTEGRDFILFLRQGVLTAQRINKYLITVDEPRPLLNGVGIYGGWQARFSVSRNGTLVYQSTGPQVEELVWFDRAGARVGTAGPIAGYLDLDLSPDGKQAAVTRADRESQTVAIWLVGKDRAAGSRFTFGRQAALPVWSPDGSRIVFSSVHSSGGAQDLYSKPTSGPGGEELLLRSDTNKRATSWSRDGRWILFGNTDAKTRSDLWLKPLGGDRKPIPFLQTDANEAWGRFSPDAKWVAYQSDESGRLEIYVRPFSPAQPQNARQWQISQEGGRFPRWQGDGKELFYLAADRKIMAVEVRGEATFEAGTPQPLFQTRAFTGFPSFAVTADGKRFLVINNVVEPGASTAGVILNFPALLRSQPQ
jgi:Tol biopolymer transport system component/predicted Ser/Thr protein kinase